MTATINGVIVTHARLSVPRSGPWFLDAQLADDTPIEGAVTVEILGTSLSGTVSEGESGAFGLRRGVRVIGGMGRWSRLIRQLGYHNDAGVSAALVAQDIVRDCGESLGTDAQYRTPKLGNDWAREAGPASRALEAALGGFLWWVDFDGITRIAPTRAVHTPAAGSYEILEFDPRDRVATIALDSLDAVRVGSTLTERLEAPEVVASYELEITPKRMRMRAWCGRVASGTTEIGNLLQSIVRRTLDQRLWGIYRYNVVNMVGDRVNVRALSASVPDLLAIKMTPGVAGAHAVLAKGAEVRVAFIEGDPAKPEIVGFAGKGGAVHVPESLSLCGSELQAARQGDLTEAPTVGLQVIFDIPPGTGGTGIPAPLMTLTPYALSFGSPPIPPSPALSGSLYGFATTGSPKVKL